MNKIQFFALCSACDRLLLAHNSNIDRIAIPWLHVLRPHPIFLKNYASIYRPRILVNSLLCFKNLFSAFINLFKSLFQGGEPWSTTEILPPRCDVLFVSHLVNKSIIQQDSDFYFGQVACELLKQGITSTIALINYTDDSSEALAANWCRARIPRVIFTPLLGFLTECRFYLRACLASTNLIKASFSNVSIDFDCRVAARAAVEAISPGTISVMRISHQIQALIARLKPCLIIITYEGHSWERVAFASARAISPGILCLGYQHATLSNLQHALQRPLANIYNPDVILTSGCISWLKLRSNPQLHGLQIEVLGSIRSVTREPLRSSRGNNSVHHCCLVLPEGLSSECNILCGFSLRCAKLLPHITFIWRFHPSISYDSLVLENPLFKNLPSNIIISSSPLLVDISLSCWALFRSSTAIVQATVCGVMPIYLHLTGEIPINTLFEVSHLHAQVVDPNDFRLLTIGLQPADQSDKFNQLQDYCEQLFTPINSKILASFVNNCALDSVIREL